MKKDEYYDRLLRDLHKYRKKQVMDGLSMEEERKLARGLHEKSRI